LGSVEATTNALGQFVNRMSFGAWGERQKSDWRPGNPTESFITSNGFTGHDQLDNHNLVHMGGRVYDPNLGRFLSADLFIQSPYDSQNYNRYSNVGNNPLSYTDPTGYKRSNLDPAQRGFAFAMQQAIYAQVNPYPNCGTGARGACIGDDGFLNLPVRRGNDGPTEDDRARMRQLNHDSYVSYHRASLDYASFGSRLPSFSPNTVNFVVGLGNSVSFGAGGYISEKINGAESFDVNSDAFSYGGYAGILGGAGGLARGLATNAPKFLYNPQSFSKISREYWKNKTANGASLHHWLFPQKAKLIPEGIRNAGFNLVQLPAFKGVFHPKLGLNQWMGFAQRWGGGQGKQAAIVENMIRVGIPGSIVGSAYIGYEIGQD